jgi:predicted MFS family arabinose efflux permease
MFIAGQVLCGLAAGTLIPATTAQVVRTVALEERASALGKVKTAWALCALVGVPLVAFLSSHIGWRLVFTLLFGGWLICLAMLQAPCTRDVPDIQPGNTNATVEDLPSSKRRLRLPALLVVNFLFFFGSYGAFAFLGVAVRQALALDASGAGWFMGIYGVGFLLGASRGKWITYLGPERAIFIAQVGLTALMACLGTLISSFALSALAAALWGVLQAFGFTACIVCASTIEGGKNGRNLALNQFSLSVGGGLGISLMGLLLARSGYGTVGLAAAAATAMSGLVCLVMSRPAHQPPMRP